jgi:AcrR family transcriptional regulator
VPKKTLATQDPVPRKQAGTDSAKALVEAVVIAAGELLIDRGLAFTTNDVAKRAGVSIGSLYQYFPNKEAVLAEATRRVNDSLRARMQEIVDMDAAPVAKLDQAIDLACSDRFGSIALRKALFMHVPRSWSYTTVVESETTVLSLLVQIADELTAWRTSNDLPTPPDRTGASVAFFMVRGAVQGALLYQPELLSNNRLADMLRPHLHVLVGGGSP